jgi:hypothetical protein
MCILWCDAKTSTNSKNPANLKPAELKKACATRGLSPMGYPDELLEALMGYLKKHGGSSGGRHTHVFSQ